MSIRDFVEQDGLDYMRRNGITPGWRGSSSSPETYQSDLVDEAVDKIMADRDELATVLSTVLENLAPPAVVDMLALLATSSPTWPGESSALNKVFITADLELSRAIEGMVRKFCIKEAGL